MEIKLEQLRNDMVMLNNKINMVEEQIIRNSLKQSKKGKPVETLWQLQEHYRKDGLHSPDSQKMSPRHKKNSKRGKMQNKRESQKKPYPIAVIQQVDNSQAPQPIDTKTFMKGP